MAQVFNTSLKIIASKYIRLLNARVTNDTIQKEIEENPYYPSLLSLSDTFDHYNINNVAYKVAKDDFDKLEPPFVAFLTLPDIGKDFALVTHISNSHVSFFHKEAKIETLPKHDFIHRFKDVIWVAEPNDNSGEADFSNKLKNEKAKLIFKRALKITSVIIIALAFSLNITSSNIFSYSAILILKLFGLSISILLLIYEVDNDTAFVKNICKAGGKTNCAAVLGSKVSKMGILSWSEIGLIYFSASTVFLFIPNVPFNEKVPWIALANALAAPYILFSLYYQWRVVKQWCLLCLAVQLILILELLWSMIEFWRRINFPPPQMHDIIGLSMSILLPFVIWFTVKPILSKAKDGDIYIAAYKRLQFNREIFESLLKQQPKAPDGWEGLGILLGNPRASNTIIKICNPYCGPCAKAHPLLEEIIKNNSDVKVRILFLARGKGAVVAKHLLALSRESEYSGSLQFLDNWYLSADKNYQSFAFKYPIKSDLKDYDIEIDLMDKWCEDAEIHYTPTIFVNSYRLPDNYTLQDLQKIYS